MKKLFLIALFAIGVTTAKAQVEQITINNNTGCGIGVVLHGDPNDNTCTMNASSLVTWIMASSSLTQTKGSPHPMNGPGGSLTAMFGSLTAVTFYEFPYSGCPNSGPPNQTTVTDPCIGGAQTTSLIFADLSANPCTPCNGAKAANITWTAGPPGCNCVIIDVNP